VTIGVVGLLGPRGASFAGIALIVPTP